MQDKQFTSSVGIEYIVPKNSKSEIAKNERKDCVVRAISSAFGLSYDKAHAYCKNELNRKDRKGTRGFEYKMNKVGTLFGKTVTKIEKSKRPKTTQGIIRLLNEGTYLVSVAGHAFTIMDGVVIGNSSDAKKGRVRIVALWLIGKEPLVDYVAKPKIQETMHDCRFCNEEKPRSEFYSGNAYKRYRDGIPPACKECILKRNEQAIRRRQQAEQDKYFRAV